MDGERIFCVSTRNFPTGNHTFVVRFRTGAQPPLGSVSPSDADLRLTKRIASGARILQIKFLDHVIVGQAIADRPGYFSFQEAGLL